MISFASEIIVFFSISCAKVLFFKNTPIDYRHLTTGYGHELFTRKTLLNHLIFIFVCLYNNHTNEIHCNKLKNNELQTNNSQINKLKI